jgi:hypothetical protein
MGSEHDHFDAGYHSANDAAQSELKDLRSKLAASEKLREDLSAIVAEALEPGVFGPFQTIEDPAVSPLVKAECDRVGYGAVIHHVQWLWEQKSKTNGHPGSEHTVAACASVRLGWIKKAKKVLKKASV